MLALLVCAAIYLVIGVLFDVFVHLTNAIIYWDRRHALKSHFYLVALWPLALLSAIIHRFGRSAILYTATALALALGLAIVVWASSAKHVTAQEHDLCVDVEEDMATTKAAGFEWIGVTRLPLDIQVKGGGMVFYRKGGIIYASPVFNGCVSPHLTAIGPEDRPSGPVLAPSQSTPA